MSNPDKVENKGNKRPCECDGRRSRIVRYVPDAGVGEGDETFIEEVDE